VRLPIHAVHPSRLFVSSKVQAVIEFFADEFRLDSSLSTHAVSNAAVETFPALDHPLRKAGLSRAD
jgi:hypothetical protein